MRSLTRLYMPIQRQGLINPIVNVCYNKYGLNTIPTILRTRKFSKSRSLANEAKVKEPGLVIPLIDQNNAEDEDRMNSLSKMVKPVQTSDTDISCTIFDKKGNVVSVSQKFPRAKFLNQFNLFPRDLRKIDSSNVDVSPIIAVRSNCILINLLHIKALIKHDQVLVFDTHNPINAKKLGLFMYDLEMKLKTKIIHGSTMSNQSYEFRALESILINVMAYLETELQQNAQTCGAILQELESKIDRNKLKDLLVNSKQLKTFYQRSLLIKNVMDELLDNDEDLEAMYLTDNNHLREKMKKESIGKDLDQNATKHRNFITIFDGRTDLDTDEIEMLLESYYKQCDEIVQQADSLISDIKSTEDIVNIILDANRNSLMVFELKITIYTLGVTIATILPAFYGMNLKNYIEDSTLAFGGVIFFSFISGVAMVIYGSRRLGLLQRLTMMSGSNKSTLQELQRDLMVKETLLKRDDLSKRLNSVTQQQTEAGMREDTNTRSAFQSYKRNTRRIRDMYRRQLFRNLWRLGRGGVPNKNVKDKGMMFKWLIDDKNEK